jgi:hypothetical protein
MNAQKASKTKGCRSGKAIQISMIIKNTGIAIGVGVAIAGAVIGAARNDMVPGVAWGLAAGVFSPKYPDCDWLYEDQDSVRRLPAKQRPLVSRQEATRRESNGPYETLPL